MSEVTVYLDDLAYIDNEIMEVYHGKNQFNITYVPINATSHLELLRLYLSDITLCSVFLVYDIQYPCMTHSIAFLIGYSEY